MPDFGNAIRPECTIRLYFKGVARKESSDFATSVVRITSSCSSVKVQTIFTLGATMPLSPNLAAESEEARQLFHKRQQSVVFGTLKDTIRQDGEGLFLDGVHRDGKLLDAMYGLLSGVIKRQTKC